MKRRILIVFGGLAVIVCLVSCFRKSPSVTEEEEPSKYLNTNPSVAYVGAEECRKCHADIYTSFMQTGMGQSFGLATRKKTSARFGTRELIYDTFRNLYYHPQFNGDTLQVVEFRLEGKDTIFKRIENIKYIVGSGQHTNSHIYEVNGFLYQAPMTYYTQRGLWNLPPGFEGGFNTRFGRGIELECISCHNDYPVFDAHSINKYETVKHGISCERCHGPGSVHIAEKLKGNTVDIRKEIDYTIVNPSKLPWQLQIDVCQRCHLQGNAILKQGKSFFDFRPGKSLNKIMDVYMPHYEGNDNQFIMASHAERLQMSPCFLKSNNLAEADGKGLKMTCITCHDPHVSVKITGKEVFNAACQKCHTEMKHANATQPDIVKEENNCVKCHMPLNGTTDIPHVTVHDHYIRKPAGVKAESDLRKFIGIVCINNSAPDAESKAEGYMNYFEKFDGKEKMAMDSAFYYITQCKNRPDMWLHYYYLMQDYKQGVKHGMKINPNSATDPWTCYRMAECQDKEGNYEQAEIWIGRALELKPEALDFLFKKGYIQFQLQRMGEARKTYESLLAKNPKYAEAWSALGLLICDKGRGDMKLAMTYYQKALALDPDLQSALMNALDIYNATGERELLLRYLKRLYKLDPRNPKLQDYYSHFNIKG